MSALVIGVIQVCQGYIFYERVQRATSWVQSVAR